MKVIFEFEDGLVREYELHEDISKKVSEGEILCIQTRHPKTGEMLKAGTVEADPVITLNRIRQAKRILEKNDKDMASHYSKRPGRG